MGMSPFGIDAAIAAIPMSTINVPKTTPPLSRIEAQLQASSDVTTPLKDVSTATASDTEPMAQVTSVSQLSDVKPTDWAFQALQSLVERYGCIVGYPDKTFRGNRALTRYEFAAGLNACLDRVNELIAAGTADLARKEDLVALQKLQEEFAAELATLRGRVGALEARTATLEKQQFSTTTKLNGEVIFSLASAYGAAPGFKDAQPVFNDRLRLNLTTSFTGKDLLITGLQAYNFGQGPSALLGGSGSLGGTLGYGDPVFGNASQVYLGYAPQFPETNPQNLTGGRGNNRVDLYKLLYIFPVANKVTAFIGTSAEVSDAFPSILPWSSEGQGALSRFATLPAAQRVSGGTSQTGLDSAAGLILNLSDAIDLRALYGVTSASLPNNAGFPGTPLGSGLFDGSYIAAAQLTVKPSKSLDIALNYAHSYHQINILGTGLAASDIGSVVFTPTAGEIARRGAGLGATGAVINQGITLDTLGLTAAFRLSPQFSLAGSFSYIFSSLVDVDASTNFLSWQVGIQANDLLRKGSTAGLIFGQPLSRVSTSGRAFDPGNRTPYQVEGFFNFKLSDNISVTPGLFVIFNAEELSSSSTVYVPVIRTTFTF
ncbi:MAG: iron uptake porin [Stenomitos rutilans HA7619-LM2]|nr:iron uptake porin [Stenomitos rutilans HA7619-LM2]